MMRALLFCLILLLILMFISYRAMTTPQDAPLWVNPGVYTTQDGAHPFLNDADTGPWL
jgi:hypothetical protein